MGLVFEIWYDSKYIKNSQNDRVGSSLDYSVTELAWYKIGVGEIVTLDVDAESGIVGDRYNLVDYNIVPIPGAVWLLGSGLIGLIGIKRKFRKV